MTVSTPEAFKYTVEVRIPHDSLSDDHKLFLFIVNSNHLPRVGEALVIDAPGAFDLRVTDVRHYFNPEAPYSEILVITKPEGASTDLGTLLDPNELVEWLNQFPMLEPKSDQP